MVLGNRIEVERSNGTNGWDSVEVKSGEMKINCSYQIKQQITIKLGFPYSDTITIETSEPINDKSDIEQFAREMLYAAELRHESNRKAIIEKNRETFRTNILPLWFEREAYRAKNMASNQNMRKEARRKLNAGIIDLKSYNDLIRALNSNVEDDDHIDDIVAYNRRLKLELCRLGAGNKFHFSYHDIERILGKGIWENSLQIEKHLGGHIETKLLDTLRRDLESFNLLYGLGYQHLTLEQMRQEYNTITTAGFGDITLAATFKKGDEIVAVMAIDNDHGRRALCHLVGKERLAELLPKRAYNAVIREDRITLQDVECVDLSTYKTIIIE